MFFWGLFLIRFPGSFALPDAELPRWGSNTPGDVCLKRALFTSVFSSRLA